MSRQSRRIACVLIGWALLGVCAFAILRGVEPLSFLGDILLILPAAGLQAVGIKSFVVDSAHGPLFLTGWGVALVYFSPALVSLILVMKSAALGDRRARSFLFGTLVLAQLVLVGAIAWDVRQYNRMVTFFDEVERLADAHASAEEVRRALGDPTHKSHHEETVSWFYDPGDYRGYSQATCVFSIDSKTQRVSSLSYIKH